MAFPITKRYLLQLGHSDTGLSPSFTKFRRMDTFAPVSPPLIVEEPSPSYGSYYFDYVWSSASDPEISLEIDAGPSSSIQYVKMLLSPQDILLDLPVSGVSGEVWSDSSSPASGTKGYQVNQIPPDVGLTLGDLAGAGFVSATHSLSAANALLVRSLGMLHENSVMDVAAFDVNNNLTYARLRLYNSKANADAATVLAAASPGVPTTYDTGKIAHYTIKATYLGTNLTTYEVVKEP